MKANTQVRCYRALIFVSLAGISLFRTALLAQDGFDQNLVASVSGETPQADSKTYRTHIEPLLRKACFQCHGAEEQEGGFRLDQLDPDLIQGDDVDWWLEVVDVLSNGEMPPANEGVRGRFSKQF